MGGDAAALWRAAARQWARFVCPVCLFSGQFFQEKFSGIKFSGDVLWVGFSEEAVRVSVAGLYGRPEERICAYNNIGMAGRGPARVVSLAFLCIRRSD